MGFRNSPVASRAGLGLFIAGITACAASPAATPSYDRVADDAYTYTLPLYELSAARSKALGSGVQQPNVFAHRRRLADAGDRQVTTPNTDTLYSSAWLLLGDGPLELTIPESGERYFSLELLDFYSNAIAVLGTRHNGGHQAKVWVAGPGWQGEVPADVELIRAPTDSLWALGRTFVAGKADLPAAWKVQAGLAIRSVTGSRLATQPPASARTHAPARTDWDAYFSYVNQLLAENPPPASDSAALDEFGAIGVGTGQAYQPEAFSAGEQGAIASGAQQAYDRARSGALGDAAVQGWVYPPADLARFGADYDYRAVVSLGGLGALPPDEAVYLFGAGDTGNQRYDGQQTHTLRFPPGQLPPAGAFWSLTLYEAEDDGNLFFYDNPQQRYAIGDHTENLQYGSDGSLTITLSHEPPGGQAGSNWLPTPQGPFALVLRAYLPQPALLDGRYRLPPVVPGG